MTAPKYQIGDTAFRATFDSEPDWVTCPDCGGTQHIRVILFDGTELAIPCEGCRSGYEPPSGRVKVYKRVPRAVAGAVSGIDIRPGKTEYKISVGLNSSWCVPENELFDNEADAMARACQRAREYDEKERAKVTQKKKPTKSWAWHVTYHRREIRRAEETLARHTAALNFARTKAEEPETK